MKTKVDFSFVLPVMNQEDHIERVINAYHHHLTKMELSFELIAVINGSSDNSYKICQRLISQLPNLSVYNLKQGGYGRGVIYGLKKAKGKYLSYINCARVYTDDLETTIKHFLASSNVLIHGIRKQRDIVHRRIGSYIFNTVCRLLIEVKSSDINGTPKIFSREIYRQIKLTYADSMIDLQFLDQVKQKQIPAIEIPVYKNMRHGGKSTSTWRTVFRLFKEVIAYWFNTRILKQNS